MNKYLMLPLLLLSGCASIINGTTQEIAISSNPQFAKIFVDNLFVGHTPNVVTVARGDNHIVRIELEGYQPYEIICTKNISNWVWGNLVFGGVIGVAVDALTGGIYRITPECLIAELDRAHLCFNPDVETQVIVVLEADPSWEKIGSLKV